MNHMYILIHGTWSDHRGIWCLPQGDFFDALSKAIGPNEHIVPFLWSGKNNAAIRLCTARALAHLIHSYPQETKVHIIAHSHGANVGFLASHVIQERNCIQNNHRLINTFFALGAPINTAKYAPHQTVIKRGYNLFSHNDTVQPIFGRWQRTLDSQWSNFRNLRLTIDGKDPEHFQLYHPLLAHWIVDMVHQRVEPIIEHHATLALQANTQPKVQPYELNMGQKTTQGILQTIKTAIKLAHYKAKSIKRSRQQRKKITL